MPNKLLMMILLLVFAAIPLAGQDAKPLNMNELKALNAKQNAAHQKIRAGSDTSIKNSLSSNELKDLKQRADNGVVVILRELRAGHEWYEDPVYWVSVGLGVLIIIIILIIL